MADINVGVGEQERSMRRGMGKGKGQEHAKGRCGKEKREIHTWLGRVCPSMNKKVRKKGKEMKEGEIRNERELKMELLLVVGRKVNCNDT